MCVYINEMLLGPLFPLIIPWMLNQSLLFHIQLWEKALTAWFWYLDQFVIFLIFDFSLSDNLI